MKTNAAAVTSLPAPRACELQHMPLHLQTFCCAGGMIGQAESKMIRPVNGFHANGHNPPQNLAAGALSPHSCWPGNASPSQPSKTESASDGSGPGVAADGSPPGGATETEPAGDTPFELDSLAAGAAGWVAAGFRETAALAVLCSAAPDGA